MVGVMCVRVCVHMCLSISYGGRGNTRQLSVRNVLSGGRLHNVRPGTGETAAADAAVLID